MLSVIDGIPVSDFLIICFSESWYIKHLLDKPTKFIFDNFHVSSESGSRF